MEATSKLLEEGIQLLEEGQLEKAIEKAKLIQEAEPNHSSGYHLEALALQTDSKWQDSISLLNKAIEYSPYDPALFNFRGFAFMNLEEFRKAKKDLKEAIELEDFEPAHRNMVLWMIMNDKIQEAIDYLTKRIQTKQDDAENFMLMGDLLSKAGYHENADSFYQKAEELSKN